MVGIGLTPEAIETNPIIYDFMMEFTWTKTLVDLDTWTAGWSHRRYGIDHPAARNFWDILRRDILNCPTDQMGPSAPAYLARPNVTIPSIIGCCSPSDTYYQKGPLIEAWRSLLSLASPLASLETYQNDLVEITRQVLGDVSVLYLTDVIVAYNNSDPVAFDKATKKFHELIHDIETILGSRPGYLLGTWVHDAARWGSTKAEEDLMIHNALLQVTLWGPATWANGLHEYAYKIWAGLAEPYYGHRWKLFFEFLKPSLESPYSFDPRAFHKVMFDFEWGFTMNVKNLPSNLPNGENTVALSKKYFEKWINGHALD
jgi:alpha-N-acetylglucosaminidase